MTKKLLCLCAALTLCLLACNRGDSYTHDSAKEAAERFCTMLITDDYAHLVDVMWMDNPMAKDSLPADLRQEYVDLLRQFKAEMPRGGMVQAKALRDSLFADSLAFVYLDICFADSTHEEILQSLVFSRGKWWMK